MFGKKPFSFDMDCIIVLLLGSILGLMTGVCLGILVCKFETEIKIWFWSHNCFMRSFKHTKTNDIMYDAFFVAAEGDKEFITNQIVPKLEECEDPYKLCLPHRDWNGVDLIKTAISKSVKESHMTIVLLSKKLLKARFEHWQVRGTVNRCHSPMIVILLDSIDDMNHHINVEKYLSLSTCTLKYNDHRFWEKLSITMSSAMPNNEKQLELYLKL